MNDILYVGNTGDSDVLKRLGFAHRLRMSESAPRPAPTSPDRPRPAPTGTAPGFTAGSGRQRPANHPKSAIYFLLNRIYFLEMSIYFL